MNLEKKVIEWRHFFHQNPEFGFEETLTSDFVANTLESFGIEVHRNIGKTGLVGILKKGNSKKSIGLRADFDALKIQEANAFEHCSKTDNMMHGCGHDGHTAMLLGAAFQLSQNCDFDGTVYFIFQPAEEQGTGAKAMIDDGLFTRWSINSVYAMHNMPGVELETFLISPNSIMAAENHFRIEVLGEGGHAALPHLGNDPLITACHIGTALQTIITRDLDSIHEPAVLSVTNIETNGGANVIPTVVTLSGDTRCFSDETQEKIKVKMERVISGQCASAGLKYNFEFSNCVLSTVNDPEKAKIAARIAGSIVGNEKVDITCKPYCTSEDFSFMQREVPSCYILIGNGARGEKGGVALHLPTYDFNDDLLMTGVQFWVKLVRDQL
ncbi:M20 aminoacylase family protein [Vibrio sp. VB16]|uniref:M20 aminoacylase family protein n=1 Tax=Vibrio sp. VB16 TaxID=2785746 RepID=UPI00189F94BD|nr:M20 aminoacylase family protein [Vibrio sp. VB16]UGA54662.1 M20 family metallopeptidase [Vibrio sp. VB16]